MFDSRRILTPWRWSGTGRAAALLWALVFWGLSAAGFLEVLEDPLYDFFLRHGPGPREVPARVLLVGIRSDLDRGGDPEGLLIAAIGKLREAGARKILVPFLPRGASREFYRQARGGPDTAEVLFGQAPWRDEGRTLRVPPLPAELEGLGIRTGLYHLPPSRDGVQRRARLAFTIEGRQIPALEALAASGAGPPEAGPAAGAFLIRYRGGPGSMPAVDLEDILAGGLGLDLARDRWILLGPVPREPAAAVMTPVSGAWGMFLLEVHGHALNSLLAGRAIEELPARWAGALFLALALAAALAARASRADLLTWAMVGLAAASIAAGHLALGRLDTRLPAAALCLFCAFFYADTLRRRALDSARSVRELLVEHGERLQRTWVASEGSGEEPWALVINMVNQTLDLSRVIFLEIAGRSRTLREVSALGCTFGDIEERRRDPTRPPYATAVEAAGPLEIPGFLRGGPAGERQYLVPLACAGDLLGFMVLGVDGARVSSWRAFERNLGGYAAHIAELLYSRREARRSLDDEGRGAPFPGGEVDPFNQLAALHHALERRLRYSEALLRESQTATIAYDPFGRVQYVNDRMAELLARAGLDPRRMTALDLIGSLSEHNLSRARRMLRLVILEGQRLALPVDLAGGGAEGHVMHLSPLPLPGPEGRIAGAEPAIRGVLCELIDPGGVVRFSEMKEKLASRLGLQLRNDLAAIDLSASLLQHAKVPLETRLRVARMIHEKVVRTTEVLVECQQYLGMKTEGESLERFPVDSQEALERALGELEEVLEERQIRVQVTQPKLMCFVLASSDLLRHLFRSVLAILIADALDESRVEIEVAEENELASFRFRNEGFGMPDERFQDYLFGPQSVPTGEFQALREAARWTEGWGGEFEASSEVGRGTRVVVRLVKFL